MGLPKKTRQIKATRLVGAAAAVLGLLFVVAFGAKVLEATRLRNWRDRLTAEVEQLERDQADWEQEVTRSSGASQRELELLNSGWVRDDLVSVVVKTATPAPTEESVVGISPTATPEPSEEVGAALFDNANWYAWRRLLQGFD